MALKRPDSQAIVIFGASGDLTARKVMPGLYAAGETVGLYHQVYTGATSVLRGTVFGRTAAQHVSSTRDIERSGNA